MANVALILLTTPHRKAAEERIFIMVAKNKTKFRSSLDNTKSQNPIMLIKIKQPGSFKPCYQRFFRYFIKKT